MSDVADPSGNVSNDGSDLETFAGYVGLVGRPNVGKSTWLNALVEERVSIISAKPQTTRHIVTGIYTEDAHQIVFVDTPGMHIDTKNALSRMMNRSAQQSLSFVDVALFIVEAGKWTAEDDKALERLADFEGRVFLIVNKVDRIKDKTKLLPYLQACQGKYSFDEIYPLSAHATKDRDILRNKLKAEMPAGQHFYEADEVTTASMRFLAAEQLREQLFRRLHKELPYSLSVACDRFEVDEGVYRIVLTVWVERSSQKPIVIGKGGNTLKAAATQARKQCEQMFGGKVFLNTWVRVRSGWADDEQALQAFGYQEDDHTAS